MKIYIGHPSSIDFEEELYRPLRESSLLDEHEFVFPHDTDEFFDSRQFLRTKCDLFIAEVSQPSTGLGIEIGWAENFGVPVVAMKRKGAKSSSSLPKVCREIIEYRQPEDLPGLILDLTEKY